MMTQTRPKGLGKEGKEKMTCSASENEASRRKGQSAAQGRKEGRRGLSTILVQQYPRAHITQFEQEE
jgi:hypothetical protein